MKKNMLPMLLFNIVEMICVIIFGIIILKSNWVTIAMIVGTWVIVRMLVDKPMHYKSPIKCFFMTIFLFVSIFLATKVSVYLGILVVIFDGIVMSKYGNVNEVIVETNKDMFQWNSIGGTRRESIYQDLINVVAADPKNPVIMKYERYWKDNYPLRHEIFVMFFRKRWTYTKIKKKYGIKDNAMVKNECRIIYSTLEVLLMLKPLASKSVTKS